MGFTGGGHTSGFNFETIESPYHTHIENDAVFQVFIHNLGDPVYVARYWIGFPGMEEAELNRGERSVPNEFDRQE